MKYKVDFQAIPARLVPVVKVICAWCKKVKQDGPDDCVSHGICDVCKHLILEQGSQPQQEDNTMLLQVYANTHCAGCSKPLDPQDIVQRFKGLNFCEKCMEEGC